ncbi:multicopper oxidase [Acrocarpospora pleiomorpha]|uniref:Multicopper oxidase n=1 Tax=Acrocarpospora pleiomorpha TaxID=90975 RepID=A0A5M3X8V6_9ACTN|nr:multicopper oxidase [Acrocarpospora pleiomorpha]GES17152.1 multicopper oxidase [Acrocarpospora pleiomorpha]
MITRRQFLQAGTAGGVLLVSGRAGWGGGVDPAAVPKYVTPLAVPPVMPPVSTANGLDHYVIGVRRFRQQILPPGSPATTVWGYGPQRHPRGFQTPGHTIEARVGRPVRVTWVNALMDGDGDYLPHLLPVDPTLHWANPPGGVFGRDSRPRFASTPGRYRGPVPIVTHLHGGRNDQDSDGYPEAWYLPAARNLGEGYARVGSQYAPFGASFAAREGISWEPGSAVFQYTNDQPPSTLWYHDHTLGLTRLNVYAGLAAFYLLRGGSADLPPGVLPGPAPALGDSGRPSYHEIPLAIQDRSFAADGSLFYPGSRTYFDGFAGPYIPGSDMSPIWNPEFFGDTMVVNGRTWPVLAVRPRRFRFRILNGCNTRVLILKIVTNPRATRPAASAVPFWQIGSDGGFLPAPVELAALLVAPAERMDVIVDFTGIPAGTELFLINEGPDGPFQGDGKSPPANPETTGQVMKFTVGSLVGRDISVPPAQLTLPSFVPLGRASTTRKVGLLEHTSSAIPGAGPAATLLGTVPGRKPLMWSDPITENPPVGATETWEIHNFTVDAHPIHIHEVQFQLVGRQPFKGAARGPERGESGYKDTVIAYPGGITTIKARFEHPGLFVWHCHILEHEDNEMMRPYRIGPA